MQANKENEEPRHSLEINSKGHWHKQKSWTTQGMLRVMSLIIPLQSWTNDRYTNDRHWDVDPTLICSQYDHTLLNIARQSACMELVYSHTPALALPVSVALFVTAHSSMSVTPVSSAQTSTTLSCSGTVIELVIIWIATFATAIQATMVLII